MRANHGNNYSGFGHSPPFSPAGVGFRGTSFGRVTAVGKAGDVQYFPTDSLSAGTCQYQAVLVQAMGGDVNVSQTLVSPEQALDPVNDPAVWAAEELVADGTILTLAAPTCSALKVQFVADATVVIAFT